MWQLQPPPLPLKKVTPSKTWGPVNPHPPPPTPPPTFWKFGWRLNPPSPCRKGGGGVHFMTSTFFYNLNRISYIHVWEEMFWVWRSSSVEKFIQFIISEIKHFLSFLSRSWIVWKFYCNSVLPSWHCWKVFSVEDFPKLNLPFLFRI